MKKNGCGSLYAIDNKNKNMKKAIKAVSLFVYRFSGLQYVVNEIESFVFRYKLRLRMVPVSYKLFILTLGVLIGGSGVFVRLEYSNLITPEKLTFENPAILPVQAKEVEKVEKVETVEETIRRVAGDFPEAETLVKIAFCESSFDRLAENKESSAKGVFQILDMHKLSAVERFNVETSTRWAVEKATKDGFKAWNASKHCWGK